MSYSGVWVILLGMSVCPGGDAVTESDGRGRLTRLHLWRILARKLTDELMTGERCVMGIILQSLRRRNVVRVTAYILIYIC